jgi:cytochrome c-type biogenesis protein CcmH
MSRDRAGISLPALLAGVLAVALVASPAGAVQPDEILPNPALESRARSISEHLRCLVCQNQSIDDSDAPLARDLRVLVRERIRAGDSDTAVQDYIVRRYGEFVLLRPVLALHTLLLWFGPALLLVCAVFGLVLSRRRGANGVPAPLSAAEQARLDALIAADEAGERPRA